MTELDTFPPVVQLLLREPPPDPVVSDLGQFRKYLLRLLPELRKQTLWTLENFKYPEDEKDLGQPGFIVRPSTGVDPFSTFGKCADPACRLLNARQIARSIGLYGDTVLIADRFTSGILSVDRWDEHSLNWFATNVRVLLALRPLFEAGVFRFYRSAIALCDQHKKEFDGQVESVTDEVLRLLENDVKYELRENVIAVRPGRLSEPPLVTTRVLTKTALKDLKKGLPIEAIGKLVLRERVHDEVFETFLDLRNSSRFGAVTFSNSRAALLTAKHVEKSAPAPEEIEVWEAARSVDLPWIKSLSVEEIVRLREQAKDALPRFRAAMAAIMIGSSADERGTKESLGRLKQEAEELSAELRALNFPRRRHDRAGLGLLGLTISVYGMLGDVPLQAMAVTSLVALLSLLHSTRRSDEQEHSKLIARPAYVLLKARELANHARKRAG
jgi:hypothetical protein